MKPRTTSKSASCSNPLALALKASTLALAAVSSAYAQTWDSNGATIGWGNAGGTWAAPTTGSSTQGWSTSSTGEVVPGDFTTSSVANFGSAVNTLGAGTINVSGAVAATTINFNAGTTGVILAGSGNITGTTITVAASTTNTISAVLAGSARTIGGDGTLVLSGPNTYNGVTTIGNNTGSSLVVRIDTIGNSATSGAVATSLGAPTSAANGLIQIGSQSRTSTLELIGSSAAQSTNRQIRIGSNNATGSGSSIILNNNTNSLHSLTFANSAFNVAATTNSNRTLTLGGSNTGNNTISGAIIPNNLSSGTVAPLTGVSKTGQGTWVLGGSNSYKGTTRVTDGKLFVNGNQTNATGALTVEANSGAGTAGNLGGTGTIGATTATIQSGGTHAVGYTANSGVGTQTFTGALTYQSGSIFAWDLKASKDANGTGGDDGVAGTDFDSVAGAGTKTADSGSIFRVVLGGDALTDIQNGSNAFWNTPFGTQTWNMSAIFSNFSGAFTQVQTSTDVSAQGSFTINGTSLTWTAVPEPTSALAGLLLGAGLLRRKRNIAR